MADNVLFKSGLASSVNNTDIKAGQLLFAINGDTGSIYYDKDSNTRIKLNADAHKLVTARTIKLAGDVTGSVDFDGSTGVTIQTAVTDNSHKHILDNITGLQSALDEKANKSMGVYYIEGNGETGSTWTGTHPDITEYYNGLVIAYKVGVAGNENGSTLNINNLGAIPVMRNEASKVTTHYAVGSILLLVYTEDADNEASWEIADYDANNNVKQNYTTGNSNYPLLMAYTAGITSTSSPTSGTRYGNKIYANPSTGALTAVSFVGSLTGKADTAGTADAAKKLNTDAGSETVPVYFLNGIPVACTSISLNAATASKWKDARIISISSTAGTTGTSIDGSENKSLILPKTLDGFTSISSTAFVGKLTGTADNAKEAEHAASADKADTADTAGHATTSGTASEITGANINGTLFTGKQNIITASWGNAHTFKIANSDGSNATEGTSVDGSGNTIYTLKLPATLRGAFIGDLAGKASKAGHADTAGSAETAGAAETAARLAEERTISLAGDVTGSVDFDGSTGVTIQTVIADDSHNHVISNVDGLQAALNAKVPLDGTGATGEWDISISGIAEKAKKLDKSITLGVNLASNSFPSFDGSANTNAIGVSGILGVSNGGTGKNTGVDAANFFLNSLSTGSSTPTDADYYISQYAGGGTTTTTYHRRPMSALWSYIANKISTNLGLTSSEYKGQAEKAKKLATPITVSLNGDVTGSISSWDGSSNLTIETVVVDDLHNHVISNIDGLQTALNGKVPLNGTGATGEWGIDVTGNAGTATQLLNSQSFKIDGAATTNGATSSFNGTQGVTLKLPNTITDMVSITASGKIKAGSFEGNLTGNVTGTATSANKLTVNAGSATEPIYFANGIPVKCVTTKDNPLAVVANTANKLTTPVKIKFGGGLSGTEVSFDGSQNITLTAEVVDDSHNHIISNVDGLQDSLNAKADKVQGVFYIEGSGETGSTWTGSHPDITEYYSGLMIAYKVGVTGNSNGSTLNINNLGAVAVKRNETGNVTTHYPIGSVIFLVYTEDADGETSWEVADYDANSDTKVTQTYTTTDSTYPLLFQNRASITSTSNTTSTSRFSNKFYVNPSTGVLKATTFKGNLDGTASKATNAYKLVDDGGSLYNAGDSNTPVYFKDGVPVTIGDDVYLDVKTENAKTADKWTTHKEFSISATAQDDTTSIDGSQNAVLYIPKIIDGFTSITATSFIGDLNGTANEAVALTSSAGSTILPIYFTSEGKPATVSTTDAITITARDAKKLTTSVNIKIEASANDPVTTPNFDGSAGITLNIPKTLDNFTSITSTKFVGDLEGSATKLGTSTVGAPNNPIYLNSGVPTACYYPQSGSWFKGVPQIKATTGAMAVGHYIDFHQTTDSTNDYDVRIDADSANQNILYLPGITGQFVVHTNNTAIGGTGRPVYIAATGAATAITKLAIAYGGTGTTTAPTKGGIIYASSTTAYASTGAGTSGQILQSNGANAPSWITPTNANTASTIVKRDSNGDFSAGTITAALNGNAATASKLANKIKIGVSGDATGQSPEWDGSETLTIPIEVVDDSHNHVISNVDGLQTALDGKVPLNGTGATGKWSISISGTADTAKKLTPGVTLKIDGAAKDNGTTTSFDGSEGVTLYLPKEITAVTSIGTGTLTATGNISSAANVGANKLVVTNTSAESHLQFSRGGYNYITAPAGGIFAFVPNGGSIGTDAARLIINSTYVSPGNTNGTISLGTSSNPWGAVYGATFSGTAAKATILATPRSVKVDLASDASASFDGSAGITPGVTGILDIGNGGTGTSTAPTQGGIIYAVSASSYGSTAAGSSGQLLQSAGTGKPTWITATNANTASTVVKRDGSGNFSAGIITASLSGNATSASYWETPRLFSISGTAQDSSTSVSGSTNVTLYAPTTMSGFASITSTKFVVGGKVTLQYDTTNECLNFVFA